MQLAPGFPRVLAVLVARSASGVVASAQAGRVPAQRRIGDQTGGFTELAVDVPSDLALLGF